MVFLCVSSGCDIRFCVAWRGGCGVSEEFKKMPSEHGTKIWKYTHREEDNLDN